MVVSADFPQPPFADAIVKMLPMPALARLYVSECLHTSLPSRPATHLLTKKRVLVVKVVFKALREAWTLPTAFLVRHFEFWNCDMWHWGTRGRSDSGCAGKPSAIPAGRNGDKYQD